jgi:hypothetical protein
MAVYEALHGVAREGAVVDCFEIGHYGADLVHQGADEEEDALGVVLFWCPGYVPADGTPCPYAIDDE